MDAEGHALFVVMLPFFFGKYLKADWLDIKVKVYNSHF